MRISDGAGKIGHRQRLTIQTISVNTGFVSGGPPDNVRKNSKLAGIMCILTIVTGSDPKQIAYIRVRGARLRTAGRGHKEVGVPGGCSSQVGRRHSPIRRRRKQMGEKEMGEERMNGRKKKERAYELFRGFWEIRRRPCHQDPWLQGGEERDGRGGAPRGEGAARRLEWRSFGGLATGPLAGDAALQRGREPQRGKERGTLEERLAAGSGMATRLGRRRRSSCRA